MFCDEYINIISYKHTGNGKGQIWVQLIVFMLLTGMKVDGLTCDFYTITVTFYFNEIIIFSYPFENGCVTDVCITELFIITAYLPVLLGRQK